MFKQNMIDWNKNKWVFRDIYNLGFPYYHIHPHKQLISKKINEKIPLWIEYVIVFGSAVGTWHTYEKDLDLCIVGQNFKRKNCLYRKNLLDSKVCIDFLEINSLEELYTYKSEKNSVYFDIINEGVMLYAKN